MSSDKRSPNWQHTSCEQHINLSSDIRRIHVYTKIEKSSTSYNQGGSCSCINKTWIVQFKWWSINVITKDMAHGIFFLAERLSCCAYTGLNTFVHNISQHTLAHHFNATPKYTAKETQSSWASVVAANLTPIDRIWKPLQDDTLQSTASHKGVFPNADQRWRHFKHFQRVATSEGTFSNACHQVRKLDHIQSIAILKGAAPDASQLLGQDDPFQWNTTCKRSVVDFNYRSWKNNPGQRHATQEHTCPYDSHPIRNNNGFQWHTILKSERSNFGDRVRKINAPQRLAALKSVCTDIPHWIWNPHFL